MQRAIIADKARRVADKQTITNKHLEVWANYDLFRKDKWKITLEQRERARWI